MVLRADELWPHWRDEWIAYRDDGLLVIDKPAGVAAHPSDAVEISDVATRLGSWLGYKPAMLHALDREASGLMVLGLDKPSARHVAQQLERGVRQIHALGVSASPRGVTTQILARRGERLLVAIAGSGGGLRAALAEARAPIAGDRDHGGAAAARLMWHVAELQLVHPVRGEPLTVRAATPSAMLRWLDAQEFPAKEAIEAHVREAVMRRYALGRRDDTDAFRLIHGAGDELAGVEVDCYGSFAVVSLGTQDAVRSREAILDAVSALGYEGVYLKLRPKQASTLIDTRREHIAPRLPVRGETAPEPLWVRELGVPYGVRLGDGLSTGLFLDQRHTRRWLRESASGKSVLNLFAYHGAFTVAAVAGGARRTVSIDASAAALARAKADLGYRGRCAIGSDHQLIKADAIRWLAAGSERFDLCVLDPPSYAKTKSSTFRAERDYQRLAALAMRRVATQGWLCACTNLRTMSARQFRRVLVDAARDARREIAEIRSLPPPLDFPPPPGKPGHLKSELVRLS